MRAPSARPRLRTMIAHTLKNSAAAPWIVALRANRPRAAATRRARSMSPSIESSTHIRTRRPPTVMTSSPARPAAAAVSEERHRGRVGALEPTERMSGLAGRGAVHRAEHRHLGDAALDAESLRDRLVEVVVGGRGDQRLVARDRGEHARFDLAEIGADEPMARVGGDRRSHLGGEVVQSGRRGHPAGRTVAAAPLADQSPARGRARRATGTRRWWRSARPCARSAGRGPADGRHGAARAATPGCRARRPRPAEHRLDVGGVAEIDRVARVEVAQDLVVACPAHLVLFGRVPRAWPDGLGDDPSRFRRRRSGGRRPRARHTGTPRPTRRVRSRSPDRGVGRSASQGPLSFRDGECEPAQVASRSGSRAHPSLTHSGRRWPSERTGSSGSPPSSE